MKIEDRGSRGRKKVRETDGQWEVGGASGWRGESDKRVFGGQC